MLIFKIRNNDIFYRRKDKSFVKLNNDNYLDASLLTKGLMTIEQVKLLKEVKDKKINNISTEGNDIILTTEDRNELRVTLPPTNVTLLAGAESIVGEEVTNFITQNGSHYRNANLNFNIELVKTYYTNGRNPSNWSTTNANTLRIHSLYNSGESASLKLMYMHKVFLPDNSNIQKPNRRNYIKLRWRANHANLKCGIVYKKGNEFVVEYKEYNKDGVIEYLVDVFDITGITGNYLVVYCWCDKWYSVNTEQLYFTTTNTEYLQEGTYDEFERVKDSLPNKAMFYITDVNNNNGVIAYKLSNGWRDSLGKIINRNYRS